MNMYSMAGIIFVFGMYYAPYVYMFTSAALKNMDPSLEEAAEMSGASSLRTMLTVTFPLIAPAIVSGMLLSFVVMLGIYGIPAVLGAPANIPVLTTYIYTLTNWSPPLYGNAASVAIILMIVTGPAGGGAEQGAGGPELHDGGGQGVPAAAAAAGAVAVADARAGGGVSGRRRGAADAWRWSIAAFRKFLFIRDLPSLFDMKQYSLDPFRPAVLQPADDRRR